MSRDVTPAPNPAPAAKPSVVGTTLENVDVINHILFHKAILSEDDDGTRLNEYVAMVREGEHLSIKDSFDRSIALAFDLVVQTRMNPWDIDLVKFSSLYLENARKRDIDLVTAGRLILLAWTVLKLQSDDLVRKVEERKEETQDLSWDEIPDWGLSGEGLDYNDRIRMAPRSPLDEKVWHEGDRKVTLMELVDAFEHARLESEQRQAWETSRDEFRARLKAEGADRFKNRVHKEDLEADLQMIWERILGRNGSDIAFKDLYNASDVWDFVTAFTGILFLQRDRKIDMWQENFPYGPIKLRNRQIPAAPVASSPQGETP